MAIESSAALVTQVCRSCGTPLHRIFADLHSTPLANSLIPAGQLNRSEQWIPLRAFVCETCYLVQLDDHVAAADIFTDDYVYFSSYSESWLTHARIFAEERAESLDGSSFVVEVGSNDGYLLKNFVARGIRCLGIEPSASVADVARAAGVATWSKFFGRATAAEIVRQHGKADLIVANNVMAHVPDLNDFIAGFGDLLSENGVVSVEAPHLLNLLRSFQFDTIYHEHYSYLSLLAVEKGVERHGLEVFDVQALPTHGGSLRYFIRHRRGGAAAERLEAVRRQEKEAGLDRLETYDTFQGEARRIKFALLSFLLEARRDSRSVACYGAAAKGNTLLNYCGIDRDLIEFAVDRNPHKQGRFLPGSRIPVLAPEQVFARKPDYLLILPWNLKEEIMASMAEIRNWGGQFVWAVPELHVRP